jgi:hypothetical protein
MIANDQVRAVLDGTKLADTDHEALAARVAWFYAAVAAAAGLERPAELVRELADLVTDRAELALEVAPADDRGEAAVTLAWALVAPVADLAPGDRLETAAAWFEELRLAGPLATGLREVGLDEAAAWNAAELIRVLVGLPRPGTLRGAAKTADARLLEAWLTRDRSRSAMGVNTWEGTEWLDRDRFVAMLDWAARLDAIDGPGRGRPGTARRSPAWVRRMTAAAEAADYRVDRLRASLAGPTAGAPARGPSTPASGEKSPSRARRRRPPRA